MRSINFFSVLLIISAIMFLPVTTKAQVTIGSAYDPQPFSVLELFSSGERGFRLPQLTERQRNDMGVQYLTGNDSIAAMGLQIFNTTNQCVETWNGERWISHCVGQEPPLLGNSPDNFEPNANNRITAFVNVMYDFQHQTLETFLTSGTANSFQWELSILDSDGNETTWRTISGARERTFRIPENFVYTIGALDEVALGSAPRRDNAHAEVRFRVITDGTHSTAPGNQLSILFINTRTSGFSIDANGVRSLLMNRARNLQIETNPNTIRVALLNLGQSGTGAWYRGERIDTGTPLDDSGRLNDAGDLGDFFQWGRIADGHQHTVWSKPSTGNVRENQIVPFDGNGATSAVVDRPTTIADLEINSQSGQVGNSDFGDKFITGFGDWGAGAPERNDLWGNTATGRDVAHIWTYRAQANNPCPPGWRAPSHHEWSDMHTGDGSNTGGTSSSGSYVGVPPAHNSWNWRDMQTNTGAFGGMLITNQVGETLFLPAVGARGTTAGALAGAGTFGNYWISTFGSVNNARLLWFNSDGVGAGGSYRVRTDGLSVRCIAE